MHWKGFVVESQIMQQPGIFLPIIFFFVLFLVLIVAFLLFVGRLILKAKNSSWSGTLIEKIHRTGKDDDGYTTNFYTLVFETSEGKKIKITTSKKLYDQYEKGDHAEKPAGKLWPYKI